MRGVAMSLILVVAAGAAAQDKPRTFGEDLALLQKAAKPIVLTDLGGQAQVIVLAELQGRVMTSTTAGSAGPSFGWINAKLFETQKPGTDRKPDQHMLAYGGEDRFWLGPEGGQFSVFFPAKAAFDFDHWFVPKQLDTEPFEVKGMPATDRVMFTKKFDLTNYSGTKFNIQVEREIRLLPAQEAWKLLNVPAPKNVMLVAFQSENTLINAGREPWKKETGLLSIWILGMFNPAAANTVVVPIKTGPEAQLGPEVNAGYFGKVPPERLVVKDGVVYFSADGKYRSKIGISPQRAKPVLGSYDSANKVLTIVQFTLPADAAKADYVNSMWEIQDKPYAGDAANSYNDGAPKPGEKPMGPFYELESSSPAAALAPGANLKHVQRTFHMTGPETELDALAKATLGVDLKQITAALPPAK